MHWGTWLGSNIALGALAFILAQAVPIFSFLIALVGSVCFAPLAMSLPGWLWLYDHGHYRTGTLVQKVVYLLHIGLVFLGLFFLVGATYAVVLQIIDAYDTGLIGMFRFCSFLPISLRSQSGEDHMLTGYLAGSAFSCADNSNSS